MDKTKLRFPAALCFLAYIGLSIPRIIYFSQYLNKVDSSQYLHHIDCFAFFLAHLAYALVAVGLFVKKPIVSAAGILGATHPFAVFLICYGGHVNAFQLFRYGGITTWVQIIFHVFLLLACLDRVRSKIWGTASAVTAVIIGVLFCKYNSSFLLVYFENLGIAVICQILLIVGALLLGMAFQTKKAPAKVVTTATGTAVTATIGTETTIEKLTKLKQLLDDGIITQEEFDSKKKQLLGM